MANRKLLPTRLLSEEGAICRTEAEMISLGEEVGRLLGLGDVVSLEGPLGAGKTQFSKGLAAGLESHAEVSSPTFALVHEYDGGRVPVAHFDFYRLESADELLTTGYDDNVAEGVTIVEWGNKFPEVLPASALRFIFEVVDPSTRIVRLVS